MCAETVTGGSHRPSAWTKFAPLALACIAFAAYSGSLRGPWILDDQMLIAHNPLVQHPQFVGRLWTSEYWASTGAQTNLYRPLPMTTYAATYWVAGQNTVPYHLVNVALHCLATILVWWLCGGAGRGIAAVAAALLFAVHPVHVEAVANVVGRSELLLTVFFLAALLLHRRCLAVGASDAFTPMSTARAAAYAFAIALAMLAALLSKESAMALVACFPIAHILAGSARNRGSLKGATLFYLPLAGAVLLYVGLRAQATGGTTLAPGPAGLAEHLALSASAAAKNIQLLLLPLQQRAVWQLPPSGTIPWTTVAIGLLAVAALCFLPLMAVVAALRRSPRGGLFSEAALAASVLMLSMLPLLHVIPNVIWVWERGLYLPSAALCWLGCIGICALKRPHAQVAACCVVIAVAAVAFPRTLWLDRLYADDLRFWSYQVKQSPEDVTAMLSLSESLLRADRTAEALRLREQAYERQPERGVLVTALASLYLKAGDSTKAAQVLTSASLTRLDFHTPVQQQQTLQILSRMSRQLELPEAADRFLSRSREGRR